MCLEILFALYRGMRNFLPKDEHLQVVKKLEQYFETLTPQELPAFVHQMLKFCKNYHSKLIFGKLQHYFHNRIYIKSNSQNCNSDTTFDSIGNKHLLSTVFVSCCDDSLECNMTQRSSSSFHLETASEHEVVQAEGTILLYIHQWADVGHESMKDYLNSLKHTTKLPEYILQPFHLSMLLSLSCILVYKKQVIPLVRGCIVNSLHEETKRRNCCWFREMVSYTRSASDIIDQVVDMR